MKKLRDAFRFSKHPVRFVLLIIVVFVVGFMLSGVASIKVWEYTNSTKFCANACHDVHPEEPDAYADSHHAQVKCVECHMGRLGTIQMMFIKAGHLGHLPAVIFNRYERPVSAEKTRRPSSDSCERCHWELTMHGDSVREIRRYQDDEESTVKRTSIVLRSGGSDLSTGLEGGAHWHVVNPVEYIAQDEQRQDIRWVRSVGPNGEVVEFNDQESPLLSQEIEESEIHLLDCMDCHNRMGHAFASPDTLIDAALASGVVDRKLPFIKKEMSELLDTDYESEQEAIEAVESFKDQYKSRYTDLPSGTDEAIDGVVEVSRELITRVVFEDPEITWRSFPDNRGHRDFPGCFRCHDGNHVSSGGNAIELNCDTCHSIPVTVKGDDAPPPVIPVSRPWQPESHLENRFIYDHRIIANEDCAACHGEISYGTDDSGFCSSSECHDTSWPRVDLSRNFEHTFSLENSHSDALCYSCHQGVQKAPNQCNECHTPPANHLTGSCDSCHQPVGWSQSAINADSEPIEAHTALRGGDGSM